VRRGTRCEGHSAARSSRGFTPHGEHRIRTLRKILGGLLWACLGAFVFALTIYVSEARKMPDLQPWHKDALGLDFRADNAGESLQAYMAREERLLRELDRYVQAETVTSAHLNRFLPGSPSRPGRSGVNWNRTFVFDAAQPRGAALLLHGLSDSPYSLRAVGEQLRAAGFYVVGLRIPGHGTLPGALTRATWRDWREAVRVGARDAAAHGAGGPFVIVGYSNGATLAVDYALEAIERTEDARPTRLILFSPALGVSRAAAFARFQRWLARLPGLHKLGWTDVLPEYDPYKYNSFPIEAGEQIYALTVDVHRRIAAHLERGTLHELPPVLAFQSVVDATIPPTSVMHHLLDHLPANGSELVLFDVNHRTAAEDLMRPGPTVLLQQILDSPASSYDITIVTNERPDSLAVVARSRESGEDRWTEAPLGTSWPRGVYSLSHVALPFRPDDPLYGARAGADLSEFGLGAVELRGERRVLVLPPALLMRLRYNPFFDYVAQRIDAAIGPRAAGAP
jgi:alpha-beta hydrolase superfamily lysophospholipase